MSSLPRQARLSLSSLPFFSTRTPAPLLHGRPINAPPAVFPIRNQILNLDASGARNRLRCRRFFSRHLSVTSSRRMGSLSALDEPLQYPLARRDESVVDDYFGVKISDPYRWLEDPDSEETKEFVQNQVKLMETVFKMCGLRDKLNEKITKLFDHPRYDAPFRRGNKYFYFHNTGLQAQNVLYMQDSLDVEAEVLLDPNALSEDGTVSLNTLSVSEDAKYLAYGLSSSGSDWVTINVMRVEDKKVEPDKLSWVMIWNLASLM